MNLEFIKPQNLGSLLMKSSQSNFNLRLPGSYLVRSYLITTVTKSRGHKSKAIILGACSKPSKKFKFIRNYSNIGSMSPECYFNAKIDLGPYYKKQ